MITGSLPWQRGASLSIMILVVSEISWSWGLGVPNLHTSDWWFQTFFSHNIWDNPSHWLSYFSRWWVNHQPDIFTYPFREMVGNSSMLQSVFFFEFFGNGLCRWPWWNNPYPLSPCGTYGIYFFWGPSKLSCTGSVHQLERPHKDLISHLWVFL